MGDLVTDFDGCYSCGTVMLIFAIITFIIQALAIIVVCLKQLLPNKSFGPISWQKCFLILHCAQYVGLSVFYLMGLIAPGSCHPLYIGDTLDKLHWEVFVLLILSVCSAVLALLQLFLNAQLLNCLYICVTCLQFVMTVVNHFTTHSLLELNIFYRKDIDPDAYTAQRRFIFGVVPYAYDFFVLVGAYMFFFGVQISFK